MSETDHPAPQADDAPQTPRVALMGEFSAGKSTLTNLLLAADPLPVRITATRLPPVWITLGEGTGLREDMDGNIHELGPEGLDGVQMDDTRLIQLQMQSGILQMCDLVDMPGISDPNMDSSVWRGVIAEADILVWCTHATQAWRQSEAAAFDSLPEQLKKNAILLITRYDKLTSDRDRRRVMARVRAETKDRFRAIFPVALLDALSADQDRERWEKSGAEPFLKALLELVNDRNADLVPQQAPAEAPATPVRPTRVTPVTERRARPRPAAPHETHPTAAGHV